MLLLISIFLMALISGEVTAAHVGPKVLYVCVNNNRGGGEQHIIEVFQQHKELNGNCEILVGKGSWLDHELTLRKINHHTTQANRALKLVRLVFDYLLKESIRELHAKNRYDIVHCNNITELPAVKAVKSGYPYKIFYTRHIEKKLNSPEHYRYYLQGVYAVICAGPEAYNVMRSANKDYNLGITSVTYIPPLFSSKILTDLQPEYSAVETRCSTREKKAFTILMVAQFYSRIEHKNHPLLMQAISYLRKKKYDLQVQLVGEGPTKKKIQQLAHKLGISDCVSFLGFRKDVINLIDLADVVVLPGSHESFGLALVEAQARGKVAIGASSSGASVIIDDKKTGLLFKPDDANDLAEKLEYLITHPDAAKQMGSVARTHSVLSFKPSYSFSKINRLYNAKWLPTIL